MPNTLNMLSPEGRQALGQAARDLAQSPAGKTFLLWLLAETEVFNFFERPPDTATLAFAEGKRSLGVKTLELLRQRGALHHIAAHLEEENNA